MNNKIMENILEEKYQKRKSGFLINDMNISSTDIAQERINHYNKNRKIKINTNKGNNIKIFIEIKYLMIFIFIAFFIF